MERIFPVEKKRISPKKVSVIKHRIRTIAINGILLSICVGLTRFIILIKFAKVCTVVVICRTLKIGNCFFEADKSKKVNCVSDSAAA